MKTFDNKEKNQNSSLDKVNPSLEEKELNYNSPINTNSGSAGKEDVIINMESPKFDFYKESTNGNKSDRININCSDNNDKEVVDNPKLEIKLNSPKKEKTYHNKKGIFITKKSRVWLFVLLVFTSIFVNLDHGTIPAATEELERSLDIDKTAIGTFGSLVFIGTAAGAVYYIFFVNKINRKINIALSFFLSGVFLCLFTVVKNVPFLFINRLVVGFFQSMVSIYIPIWIDQYSPTSMKTLFMAIFQLSSPFGLITGYILTSLIKDKHSVSLKK